MNEPNPVKSNDTLKLLQRARESLNISFKQSRDKNIEYNKLADESRDEMLRVEGAIQQIDIFVKQIKGKS